MIKIYQIEVFQLVVHSRSSFVVAAIVAAVIVVGVVDQKPGFSEQS